MTEHTPPSAAAAEEIHKLKGTMATLEATIAGLRAIGSVRGVQCIELELAKARRQARQLAKEQPAVADAFFRLRRAEDQERLQQMRIANQHRERQKEASKAIQDREAAVAVLRDTKRKIQEMESISACRHAVKTFTLEALGECKRPPGKMQCRRPEDNANAGGPKARKNRFEVLDRVARIRAGLSAGQKNDWAWFKEAWDKEMVNQHGANWPSVFARWMQNVVDDECSNAFSKFVYNETCRVFHGTVALHVPGG